MDKRRLLYLLLVVAFFLGVVLLIVGGVLYWHYHTGNGHSSSNLDQRNVLKEDLNSTMYKEWLTSSDVYQYFYFFDVQPHDRLNQPVVKEVGPYVYRVRQKKTNVKYSTDETLVDYHEARSMEFVPRLSCGQENDTVTVPNIPAVALVTWLQYIPLPQKLLMQVILWTEPLYVRVSVADLLWGQRISLWERMREYFSNLIPNDTWFGLIYRGENRSTADSYQVWTGADKATHLRKVAKWNNQSSLSFWKSSESNQLNGTDGSAFEPNQMASDAQYVFDPLCCRSVEFVDQGNESVSNLTVHRYTLSPDVFNNSLYAQGFCTGGKCLPPGVMNATACQVSKVPLMWSEPHFYNADPKYRTAVRGLTPNKTLHESVIVVEPLTGSIVSSSRKLQMNVHIQHLLLWPLGLFHNPVFPVMWMEEKYEMPESERNDLSNFINKGGNTTNNNNGLMRGMVVLMAVGGALVLISLLIGLVACIIARRSQRDGEDDPLIVA